MKFQWINLLLLVFVLACQSGSQDQAFKKYAQEFYSLKEKQFAFWMPLNNQSPFDTLLPIANAKRCSSDLQFCKAQLQALNHYKASRLTTPMRFEHQKIKDYLQSTSEAIAKQQVHRKDPSYYDLSPVFRKLSQTSSITVEQKTTLLQTWFKQLPDYYQTAIDNLEHPDHNRITAALQQQIDFYRLCKKAIASKSPTKHFDPAITQSAQVAIKDYIAFLNSQQFEINDTLYPTSLHLPLMK